MEIQMTVRDVEDVIEAAGGNVTDIGYESFGSYKKAFVEVYFEGSATIPEVPSLREAENIIVNDDWDAENGGVLYEVTLSE